MEKRGRWEHCQLDGNCLFFYRTGKRTSVQPTFEGRVGAVAQLEAKGWELVAVEKSIFYFKRPWEEKE